MSCSPLVISIIEKTFFSIWRNPIYGKEFDMQVLDRLKIELSNQEYFTDEQYIQFGRLKKSSRCVFRSDRGFPRTNPHFYNVNLPGYILAPAAVIIIFSSLI